MSVVKIIVTDSDPKGLAAWGEVKAVDIDGRPTIAHVEISMGRSDTFSAAPGRYSLHFRVTAPGRIVLAAQIDLRAPEQHAESDAREVTAGLRYNFEVPK